VLQGDPAFDRLRDQVREIASALLEVVNIPAVAAQRGLLDEVSAEEWWQDVTLPMLELLRRRVRSLVRLVPKAKRRIVYTDFADAMGPVTEVTITGTGSGVDRARFEAKARLYLRSHLDHVALQKLYRNKPLTTADLDELRRMMVEAGVGDETDIDEAAKRADGFGLLLRRFVGLDRQAATEAVDGFIAGRPLTGNQLYFLQDIVSALTQNGSLQPGRLYESPFSERAPQGPEGLFGEAEANALFAVLDQVIANARPDVA
jgi:type I restriction enzyme R subunit